MYLCVHLMFYNNDIAIGAIRAKIGMAAARCVYIVRKIKIDF